jgi:hypothetical protein
MTDDRGTDLTVSPNGIARAAQISKGAQISADGKTCIIEIVGQEVPSVGANYIAVAGTISLKCGSKKEIGRQENVALKPGTPFSVGGITFQFGSTGPAPKTFELPKLDELGTESYPKSQADAPKESFQVTLQGKVAWDDIASVRFLDAEGKDLGARPGPSGAAMKCFILPKKVETATIVVTCWEEFKDIEAPFDVKATVGIP